MKKRKLIALAMTLVMLIGTFPLATIAVYEYFPNTTPPVTTNRNLRGQEVRTENPDGSVTITLRAPGITTTHQDGSTIGTTGTNNRNVNHDNFQLHTGEILRKDESQTVEHKDPITGISTWSTVFTATITPPSGGGGSGSGGSGGSGSGGGGGGGTPPRPSPPPPPPPGFLSIVSITPGSYVNNTVGVATVTVRNTGGQSKTGNVTFAAPLEANQSRSVTLSAGASATLTFNFRVPLPGTFNLTASADNSRTQPCTATGSVYAPPADGGNGSNAITWTEEESHTVTYQAADGSTRSFQCTHHFTYRATLTPTVTLTPSTLKSGYGFAVDARAAVAVTLTQQGGGCTTWRPARGNAVIPAPPDQAEVRTNWTVTMTMRNRTQQTQQRNTPLERQSHTANSVIFQARRSNISETGERRIYTNVSLAGTAARPVSHPVTVWYNGGGIPSRNLRFTTTVSRNITINGNMYEDDHTG